MQESPCFHVRPASTTAGDLSQVRQNASRGILGVIYTSAHLVTISTQVRINHKTYAFEILINSSFDVSCCYALR